MTQQEILEYNETCVKFLGWRKTHPNIKDWHIYITPIGSISYDKMLFHSDWNWIMEVKSRIVNLQLSVSPSIHRLYFNTFACKKNHDEEFVYKVRIHSDFKELEFKSESNDEKEAVVQAIWNFLNWYNENKLEYEPTRNT